MSNRNAPAGAAARDGTATIYMAKKMLIDATHLEETRVVVADGNKVDEFDFESINKRQLAGNIYLAKVTRVEPSLQAAFVDYGGNRHGFLAFPEIHPDYYQIPVADREALLAEEAAEQARSAAGDDDGEAVEEKSNIMDRHGQGLSPTSRGVVLRHFVSPIMAMAVAIALTEVSETRLSSCGPHPWRLATARSSRS